MPKEQVTIELDTRVMLPAQKLATGGGYTLKQWIEGLVAQAVAEDGKKDKIPSQDGPVSYLSKGLGASPDGSVSYLKRTR